MTPRLTRCFRGHSTPAGKTFCESCGASLEDPTKPPAGDRDADDVAAIANRRRHPRRPGDVVPATDKRRIRFPKR